MRVGFKLVFSAAAALLMLILSGCVTRANIPDNKPLDADQGLLALRINSNDTYVLEYATYEPNEPVTRGFAGPALKLFIRPGLNYYVVPLKRGAYTFGFVEASGGAWGTLSANLSGWSPFSINRKSITYIGDFVMKTSGNTFESRRIYTAVSNRSDAMQEYLRVNYPHDMSSMSYSVQVLKNFKWGGQWGSWNTARP